jgi:hypothetical protein
VPIVGPTLGHNVDDSSGGAAILGLKAGALDLGFLHYAKRQIVVRLKTPVRKWVTSWPSRMKVFSEPDAPSTWKPPFSASGRVEERSSAVWRSPRLLAATPRPDW